MTTSGWGITQTGNRNYVVFDESKTNFLCLTSDPRAAIRFVEKRDAKNFMEYINKEDELSTSELEIIRITFGEPTAKLF